LSNAMKCPICKGYLDPAKSASYDHIDRVQDGGKGSVGNGQVTHPYCNSAIKN
jgi:HNH endonuclease